MVSREAPGTQLGRPVRLLLTILCFMTGHVDRIISKDSYGRRSMQRIDNRVRTGFIRIHYSSRALEWINVRRLF
jgi:hypothetical protein